ncbi:MAG: hypothetical protein U0Q21_10940 [Dermatophilaceae bacterium]
MSTDDTFVSALRQVAASTPPHMARQPAYLRSALTRRLGELAPQYRSDIHLVCGALDENIPESLTDLAPLTTSDLTWQARHLASCRSWSVEAAEHAVRTWVAALRLPVHASLPSRPGEDDTSFGPEVTGVTVLRNFPAEDADGSGRPQ